MADKGLSIQFDTRDMDRKFRILLKKIKQPRPLMKILERYVDAVTKQMFSGRRPDRAEVRGVKWPKLKESTIFQKRALKARGKAIEADRPLVRTGKLRDSLKIISRGAKGFVFGTIIKGKKGFAYPGLHNVGKGNIPQRRWIFLTRKDFAQFQRVTVDFLTAKLKNFKSYIKR